MRRHTTDIKSLAGVYKVLLARSTQERKLLQHEVRIDEQGGCSVWFVVVSPTSDRRETQSLQTAIGWYNES